MNLKAYVTFVDPRVWLGKVVICALILLGAAQGLAAPNIIFILADDLGNGDVGAFFQNLRKTNNVRSEPWHMTPKLDTLAAEGIRLPRHYCPAPVCAPSRASLLLGVHQGHANVRDNQFDKALENNHTLGTVLKQAGYATAAIGKYGLQGGGGTPAAWPAYPTKRGFDYYFGYVRHGDGHEHYPKEGLYRGTKECYDGETNITPVLDKCYTADLFTARAKKWIVDQRNANPSQPFFLYLAYDTPHAVLELPTQAYPPGGGTNGGLQWLGTAGNMINTANGTIDSFTHPDYAAATWDDDANTATAETPWPDVYKRYATSVRRIDDCVGDIMTLLQQLNIGTNTLIVFTSDNGPSSESYLSQNYDPWFFNSFGPHDGIKRDTWEGGIRVGALARWPAQIPANRYSALPCSAADWMATFADMAGLPVPARADGVSLLPTLTGAGTQKAPLVYIEYYHNGATPSYAEFDLTHQGRTRGQMQVLFEGAYKGVRYNVTSATNDFEIYNSQTDPKETNNVASSPSLASLQQFFKSRVLQVRRPNSTAARPYDSALVPASTNSIYTNGIVEFAAYQGTWPWVPELGLLAPVSTGHAVGLDLNVRPRDTNFAIAFRGHITIPADADYTFYLNSDNGAHFRIHDATVIDDDFARTGAEVSGSIRLAAGRHPFRLYYRHGTGTRTLQLQYSGTGIPKQPVPVGSFSVAGIADSRPSPMPDQAGTQQNTPVLIPVLANDTDDGLPSPLAITAVTQPPGGTSLILGNQVRYTPNAEFLGEDSFSYTVSDGQNSASASVKVTVVFLDSSIWFPLDQTAGLETFDAGGYPSAILSGFGDDLSPWVAGRFGNGLEFTGGQYATIQNGYLPPSGKSARTTAAWIRATGAGAIIAWGPNSTSRKWHMRLESGTPNTGALRIETGGGYARGVKDLRDGQWHHVAGILPSFPAPDSTNLLLYVDGALEPLSGLTSSPINTDSVSVTIGVDSQSRYFDGTIDEVRIYDRALSAAEIAALYAETNHFAAQWHRRYFGNAAMNWLVDDDADGGARLLEYALGAQPHLPDADRMSLHAQLASNYLEVRYPRRFAGTHELAYTLQSSENLVDWIAWNAAEIGTIPDIVPGYEWGIFQAASPLSQQSCSFVRLLVSWQ